MIEVNGLETKTKYYLNPDRISCFHKHEGGTYIFTDRKVRDTTLVYYVSETVEQVLDMIADLKVIDETEQ